MTSQPQTPTLNIIGKFLGWQKDLPRIELMTQVLDAQAGMTYAVEVAPDPKRLTLLDFLWRKKNGLRIGGIVLLWRASFTDGDTIVCKEVHTLHESTREGPCVVVRDAAVFLHAPPAASTIIPETATVAVIGRAKTVRNAEEAVRAAVPLVDEFMLFGKPGIMLTGTNAEGDVEELPVEFATAKPTAEEVERRMLEEIDPDTAAMMAGGWSLVPTFTAEIDGHPDRRSKAAALYNNKDFGTPDAPMFTRTNAVMRGVFSDFFVADISPLIVDPNLKPQLLYDLL